MRRWYLMRVILFCNWIGLSRYSIWRKNGTSQIEIHRRSTRYSVMMKSHWYLQRVYSRSKLRRRKFKLFHKSRVTRNLLKRWREFSYRSKIILYSTLKRNKSFNHWWYSRQEFHSHRGDWLRESISSLLEKQCSHTLRNQNGAAG